MLYKLISECTDYEFKVCVEQHKPKSWLKSISAFANTIGGTIFFGLSNDNKFIGITNPQEVSDYISRVINTKIKPTPSYVLMPLNADGKIIISVKVYSGTSTPYYYESDGVREAFIRSGNESIIAPNHILNELILKGNNQTYDSIKTSYKKNDYSFSIFEASFYDITKNRISSEEYQSLNLVDENGFLTNAGVLLADQSIYRHSRIFCTHWNGINKTSLLGEALDDKEISGSIINQLYGAIDFIKANTKNKWKKIGLLREEKPEYQIEALREAIINAIIHREYTRLGVEVSIDIYENRIEITSPGGMVTGKVIDKSINKIIASERQNPVLADLFARMKFMERRSSGLKKITEKTNILFDDNENHVEFFSDSDYFKVTIYNANYDENKELSNLLLINSTKNSTNNSTKNSTKNSLKDFNDGCPIKLTETEKQIIKIFSKNQFTTIKKISNILLKDVSTIKKIIHKLKVNGIIIREGDNRNGRWVVIKNVVIED